MGLKIVLAEDESIIRLDLVELLKETGFEVVAQTNRGDEAVELVKQHKPDVAILDVKMPGLDGISATSQIAAFGTTAVVILSAFSQQDLLDQAQQAGAQSYLIKPFHKDELIPAIETACSRYSEKCYISANGEQQGGEMELSKKIAHAKAVLMDDFAMSEALAWQFIRDSSTKNNQEITHIIDGVIDGTIVPQDA